MKVIGYRAEKDGIHWAVVEGTQAEPKLVVCEYIRAPEINDEAQSLHYLRTRVLADIARHAPVKSFVRYPETNRKQGAVVSADSRSRIEGIILQALAEMKVRVVTGVISRIKAMTGLDDPRDLLKNGTGVGGLTFPSKNLSCREAILSAFAAAEKGD